MTIILLALVGDANSVLRAQLAIYHLMRARGIIVNYTV